MTSRPQQSPPGVQRLLEVVAALRSEGGCPWDREQTLDSLKPYLIEEAYELLDAIEQDSVDRHREELGDVLLQIVLQARIRDEQGCFDFDDVAARLADKLVRRHPHVFGSARVSDSGEVLSNWEAIKARERSVAPAGDSSVLSGVPSHLPALLKAQRVQAKAARVGFDWRRTEDVAAKVEEELTEVRQAMEENDREAVVEEVGDLLFAVVNLGRFAGIDAEDALRRTVDKFMRRFRGVESEMRAQGRSLPECPLEVLDAAWNRVKAAEKEAAAGRAG